MMKRDLCLKVLAQHHRDEIVVPTFTTAMEWVVIHPSPLNYTAISAMGQASSHGLGFAIGRPDRRVWVLDGDGSLLMNLGTLVTIAAAAPRNLIHFVSLNGNYEATGGQPIPGHDRVDFAGLARAAGYASAYEFSDLAEFTAQIGQVLQEAGPVFVVLRVEPGERYPANYRNLEDPARRQALREALRAAHA